MRLLLKLLALVIFGPIVLGPAAYPRRGGDGGRAVALGANGGEMYRVPATEVRQRRAKNSPPCGAASRSNGCGR